MNSQLLLTEYNEAIDRSRNWIAKRKQNKIDVLFVDSVRPRLTCAFAVEFQSDGQAQIIGRTPEEQIISCRVETRLIENICIEGGG